MSENSPGGIVATDTGIILGCAGLGAAIGSTVPILGTAIGTGIGGIVGGILVIVKEVANRQ